MRYLVAYTSFVILSIFESLYMREGVGVSVFLSRPSILTGLSVFFESAIMILFWNGGSLSPLVSTSVVPQSFSSDAMSLSRPPCSSGFVRSIGLAGFFLFILLIICCSASFAFGHIRSNLLSTSHDRLSRAVPSKLLY